VPDQQKSLTAATAFRFVLILGIANGFADLTYEGARSVTGQFLGHLGASAAVIGFTAGLGELLGYVLRSFSGYLGDKTGKYWLVTIVGYIVNMLAVPALALAGNWPLAAGLIVAERTGRYPQTVYRCHAIIRRSQTRPGLGLWLERSIRSGRGDLGSPGHFSGIIQARQLSNRFRAASSLRAPYDRDCFRR
jgi:hypothetical protein